MPPRNKVAHNGGEIGEFEQAGEAVASRFDKRLIDPIQYVVRVFDSSPDHIDGQAEVLEACGV